MSSPPPFTRTVLSALDGCFFSAGMSALDPLHRQMFSQFVASCVSMMRVSGVAHMYAMYYYHQMLKKGHLSPGDIYATYVSCVLLGTKYTEDNPYNNFSFSCVSGVHLRVLNRREHTILRRLEYNLCVSYDVSHALFCAMCVPGTHRLQMHPSCVQIRGSLGECVRCADATVYGPRFVRDVPACMCFIEHTHPEGAILAGFRDDSVMSCSEISPLNVVDADTSCEFCVSKVMRHVFERCVVRLRCLFCK